ncbi:MAG TPA: helix-turn-helix domain-containing protein [Terracidiphilus sp.]|nr:helix-turn-helix domain-containing protein [Terracidiphilus sp.]
MQGKKKREVRSAKFEERVVQRMMAGEPVSRLSRELKVRRSLLYRWRNSYRKEGVVGFRPIGRPGWSEEKKQEETEVRISALESKIGRQVMVIHFLQKACRRVEGLRRPNKGNGGPASTERSRP